MGNKVSIRQLRPMWGRHLIEVWDARKARDHHAMRNEHDIKDKYCIANSFGLPFCERVPAMTLPFLTVGAALRRDLCGECCEAAYEAIMCEREHANG